MGIFSKNSDLDNATTKKSQPTNIIHKSISKNYNVNGEYCAITMQDAKFAEIDGGEKLLDEHLIYNTFEEIITVVKRNSSKYNPVPRNIVINYNAEAQVKSNNSLKENNADKENNKSDGEFVNYYKPKWSFDQVFLDEQSKNQILSALTISKYKDKLFKEWGLENSFKNGRSIVLNFFGQPGTGKSMAAEAIAKYLGKEVCSVNYAQLESKYVGETPKNIKKVFEIATEKDAVIIFDEADSFLGKRISNVTQSSDYGVNITRSVMLLELENFDGVVIFTTNLISNYDDAFKRRILASVEFNFPDKNGRESIWKTHIPDKLPVDENITFSYLADKYENISGADIKDILLNASVLCIQRGAVSLNRDDFDTAYNYIMNRYKTNSNFQLKREVITKEQYESEINEAESRLM